VHTQPSKGPVATAVSLTEEAGALAAEEEGVLACTSRYPSTQVFDGFDLNRVGRTQGTSDLNLFPFVFSKVLVITVVIEEVVHLPRPIVDYERR